MTIHTQQTPFGISKKNLASSTRYRHARGGAGEGGEDQLVDSGKKKQWKRFFERQRGERESCRTTAHWKPLEQHPTPDAVTDTVARDRGEHGWPGTTCYNTASVQQRKMEGFGAGRAGWGREGKRREGGSHLQRETPVSSSISWRLASVAINTRLHPRVAFHSRRLESAHGLTTEEKESLPRECVGVRVRETPSALIRANSIG